MTGSAEIQTEQQCQSSGKERKKSFALTLLFKLISTPVFLLPFHFFSEFAMALCFSLSVCVCAAMYSRKRKNLDPQENGWLVVAEGGAWRPGCWVWCSYLHCADENMSLPAGCCSFSGQGQHPCGERDYGHTVPSLCLWGSRNLHLVVLFVGHFSGM